MGVLLIADKNPAGRKEMTEFFSAAGYQVRQSDSAARVLLEVLQKKAQVVLLSGDFDDVPAADLVSVLRRCDPHLTIILVSDESSPALLRKMRRAGIFYHALTPHSPDDTEELSLAVRCAFSTTGAAVAAPMRQ